MSLLIDYLKQLHTFFIDKQFLKGYQEAILEELKQVRN